MNVDDILLMILDAAPNGIPGKTSMQKIGYFCSVLLDYKLGYFAHYYGPYSKLVATNLQSLADFDLIRKQNILTGNLRKFTKYEINEDGKQLIDEIKSRYSRQYDVIKDIVKYSENEGMNYNILSYAAKVHYILDKEHRKITEEEIVHLANYYDWKLSESDIARARNLLESLDLVTFS